MSKKNTRKSETKITVAVPSAGTMSIPLSRIIVDDSFNARTQGMDDKSMAEFAATLDREGLLQPVVVEPLEDGNYFLKAGFRRVRAAGLLKWETIDATVKVAEGQDKKEQEVNRYFTNLAENVARQNLTPYDTAMRCKLLKSKYGLKGADIAKRIGKNVGYINNLLLIAGEGEKGGGKGATLHPDILARWKEECGWAEGTPDAKKTKVCLTDTLRRWVSLPHDEQMKLFNRSMFIADGGNAEEYDKKLQAQQGQGTNGQGNQSQTDAKEKIRASKSNLEKALDAVKERLKTPKLDKEEITRLNGVAEGLTFALGVKEGLTNRIKGVVAFKDGKQTEGAAAPN